MQEHRRISPASFVKHASNTASFYGFTSLRQLERTVPKISSVRSSHSFSTSLQIANAALTPTAAPVLTYWATPNPTPLFPGLPEREVAEFGLHVVGSPEGLGEVFLIKTILTILREWHIDVARVRINALGDRDSKVRFERELSSYLKKRLPQLDLPCRKAVNENPSNVYACTNSSCREVVGDGPRPINFLSERSRAHFREVLEYLEGLDLSYELDDLLVGDDREPRTLFTFDFAKEDATVMSAWGGRYDDHLHKLTNKKEGSVVSGSIFFHKKGAERSPYILPASTRAPKIYFVQLGLKAKLRGLTVMDALRQAQVPVLQSFDAKSLSPQLQTARERGVSHLIIMGQREALDGTVIIRSTQNSSQTTVQLHALPRFLKTLRV